MTRIQAEGMKFKRVEVAMRKTLLGFGEVAQEVDKALARRRTPRETALLKSIREEWIDLHKRAASVAGRLLDGVRTVKQTSGGQGNSF